MVLAVANVVACLGVDNRKLGEAAILTVSIVHCVYKTYIQASILLVYNFWYTLIFS